MRTLRILVVGHKTLDKTTPQIRSFIKLFCGFINYSERSLPPLVAFSASPWCRIETGGAMGMTIDG